MFLNKAPKSVSPPIAAATNDKTANYYRIGSVVEHAVQRMYVRCVRVGNNRANIVRSMWINELIGKRRIQKRKWRQPQQQQQTNYTIYTYRGEEDDPINNHR